MPHWIDSALAKAVHLHPENRYQALSEMLTDLQQPNPDFLGPEGLPLLERNPLVFWQALAGGLALVILLLVVKILMS